MKENCREQDFEKLKAMADRIRLAGLEMAHYAGKGGAHFGGSFSAVEIFVALYGHVAKYKANEPLWEGRDRILLSKGHCALAVYPALAEAGFIDEKILNSYVDDDGILASRSLRPEMGMDYAAGTLGMAAAVGIGHAIAGKRSGKDYRVFVILGDGECQEGSVWEAIMSAGHYGLNNLTFIMDNNHLCYDGKTEEVMNLGSLEEILGGFGWKVNRVDGHDIQALCEVLEHPDSFRPQFVIADTIKGKGVSFMEGVCEWHQGAMTEAQYQQAKQELLGGK